jgi:hypothetical protein
MLAFLFDLVWFFVTYIGTYKGCIYIFDKHPHLFKVVFDVDFRFTNFSREMSVWEKHNTIHTIISVPCAIFLSLNPIIHSILFAFMGFVDIVLLNRLLLYITLLKIGTWVNPYSKPKKINYMETVQIIYIMINYINPDILVPVLFQIFDEFFDLEVAVDKMNGLYSSIVGNDTRINQILFSIKTFLSQTRSKRLIFRKVILGLITITCFVISPLNTWGEIIFYYYAAVRILILHYNIKTD